MFNGIYSSASAMDVAARQHEIISNNLAHLNVPGFRRTILAVQSRANPDLAASHGRHSLNGSQPIKTFVDFSAGPISATTRPLDLAIDGEGFFQIQDAIGDLYTRNGSFQVSADGQLVTADGLAVQGTGGPIQIPTDVELSQILVGADGTIRAAGNEIGQIAVTEFGDVHSLVQVGPTRFRALPGAAPFDSDSAVQQGFLESSNTVAVSEMIQMIVGMRHFESAQQSLRTISEAIRQFTNMDS